MGKKFTILLYAAAATTLIAGLLHLTKVADTIGSGDSYLIKLNVSSKS